MKNSKNSTKIIYYNKRKHGYDSMERMYGIAAITSVCILVILIGVLKKNAEVLFHSGNPKHHAQKYSHHQPSISDLSPGKIHFHCPKQPDRCHTNLNKSHIRSASFVRPIIGCFFPTVYPSFLCHFFLCAISQQL